MAAARLRSSRENLPRDPLVNPLDTAQPMCDPQSARPQVSGTSSHQPRHKQGEAGRLSSMADHSWADDKTGVACTAYANYKIKIGFGKILAAHTPNVTKFRLTPST